MKKYKIILVVVTLALAVQILSADKVADFKLEDIKGNQVWLSELQGDGLVIIDFWATWCVPCKNGLPKLDAIHNKYDQVNVITINTDKPRKKMEAKAFIKSNKYTFHTLFDPQNTAKKLMNVTNIPRTFILDNQGEIIYDHTGYVRGDEKHYEEVIINWLENQEKTEQPVENEQENKIMLKEADKEELKKAEVEQDK